MGGTENGPGVEAMVVAVHRSDFVGSKCVSGLLVATAVKALEEAQRWGDVHQGLLTRRGPLLARRPEKDPWTRTLRLFLHPPQALALAQDLQGYLLMFDLDQRLVEGDGSWGRQDENATRLIEMRDYSEGRVVSEGDAGSSCTGLALKD